MKRITISFLLLLLHCTKATVLIASEELLIPPKNALRRRIDASSQSDIESKSSLEECDTSSPTIRHTGISLSTLRSIAASNSQDGYLIWAISNQDRYKHSTFIPTSKGSCKGIGFHWTIDSTKQAIHIAAAFYTASPDKHGWGAVGFSETGGMRGADIVYFSTSTPNKVIDAHVLDYLGHPFADDVQDWVYTDSTVTDDGYLIFEASRKLDTTDVFDRVFADDSSVFASNHNLIGAWGSSSNMMNHGENHVHQSIQLFQSLPSNDNDHKSNSGASVKLAMRHFSLPVESTYYHEECFSAADLLERGFFEKDALSSKRYVLGYEFLVQPSMRKYMHHMIVYAHNEDVCTHEGRAPVFGWPGEDVINFPQGIGMKFGGKDGIKSLTIHYHINNRDLESGIIDNESGVKLYFTAAPVKHELGLMQIGDPFVALRGEKIGSGYSLHSMECPTKCSENKFVDDEITIVKEVLHMHSHGKRIVNHVIRNDKVIHESYIDYWDFRYKSAVAATNAPFQMRKGDSFLTKCYYNDNSDTHFGIGTQDEMCQVFIYYYPKQPLAYCGVNYIDETCRGNYMGQQSLHSEKQLGRHFGNEAYSNMS